MREAGVPTAVARRVHVLRAGRGADGLRLLPGRAEGRRARRRQGRDHRRRPARGARGAARLLRRRGASARPARACWSRSSSRARSCRCSRCATASAPCRWRRRRTSSGSATATPGPNTGGMGSYSPGAGHRRRRAPRRSSRAVHQPIVDALRAPRHALPRRPLRRADDDRGRAARCSSSTAASATPRPRPCCRGCAATCSTRSRPALEPGGLAGVQLEWSDDWAVTVVMASARLPGVVEQGRRDRGPRRTSDGRGGHARRHGAQRRRRRDRRRPGAERDRRSGRSPRTRARAPTRRSSAIDFDGAQYRRDIAARSRRAGRG